MLVSLSSLTSFTSLFVSMYFVTYVIYFVVYVVFHCVDVLSFACMSFVCVVVGVTCFSWVCRYMLLFVCNPHTQHILMCRFVLCKGVSMLHHLRHLRSCCVVVCVIIFLQTTPPHTPPQRHKRHTTTNNK